MTEEIRGKISVPKPDTFPDDEFNDLLEEHKVLVSRVSLPLLTSKKELSKFSCKRDLCLT